MVEVSFKYLRGNVTFAGLILELKCGIQCIRKRTFIEVNSLKIPHHNNFCVKQHNHHEAPGNVWVKNVKTQ